MNGVISWVFGMNGWMWVRRSMQEMESVMGGFGLIPEVSCPGDNIFVILKNL